MWNAIKTSFLSALFFGAVTLAITFLVSIFAPEVMNYHDAWVALGSAFAHGAMMAVFLFFFGLLFWEKEEAVFGTQFGALAFILYFGYKIAGIAVFIVPMYFVAEVLSVVWPFVLAYIGLAVVVTIVTLVGRKKKESAPLGTNLS